MLFYTTGALHNSTGGHLKESKRPGTYMQVGKVHCPLSKTKTNFSIRIMQAALSKSNHHFVTSLTHLQLTSQNLALLGYVTNADGDTLTVKTLPGETPIAKCC